MALGTQTPKEYYEGSNKGNYQYITATDIINNFIVSQVGDDKIIKSAKRAEVAFHAQRGIQELNYDTVNSLKTQEFELPPSLSVDLPHDFVSYVKITYVDDAGIERAIKPAPLSSAPSSVLQDENYNLEINTNREASQNTKITNTYQCNHHSSDKDFNTGLYGGNPFSQDQVQLGEDLIIHTDPLA